MTASRMLGNTIPAWHIAVPLRAVAGRATLAPRIATAASVAPALAALLPVARRTVDTLSVVAVAAFAEGVPTPPGIDAFVMVPPGAAAPPVGAALAVVAVVMARVGVTMPGAVRRPIAVVAKVGAAQQNARGCAVPVPVPVVVVVAVVVTAVIVTPIRRVVAAAEADGQQQCDRVADATAHAQSPRRRRPGGVTVPGGRCVRDPGCVFEPRMRPLNGA